MEANGRLFSMFPARGGPVVDGGVVYFGAGLFPTQGFFLHALDAATEKCSGWTGSPNLLLYRTGAINYYDFLRDEGRSDVGGVRPSCFVNVFAAGGMVLAPEDSSGCTCSYLHRTSIAMQPLPQKEHWGLFMGSAPEPGVVRRVALNIGAIGDRRGPDGNLWLAFPRPAMGITTENRAGYVHQASLALAADAAIQIASTLEAEDKAEIARALGLVLKASKNSATIKTARDLLNQYGIRPE